MQVYLTKEPLFKAGNQASYLYQHAQSDKATAKPQFTHLKNPPEKRAEEKFQIQFFTHRQHFASRMRLEMN